MGDIDGEGVEKNFVRGFITLLMSLAGACWRGAKVANEPWLVGPFTL